MADYPDLLANRARLSPDKEAMKEFRTGDAVSYGELDERSRKAVTILKDHGVGEGDRVAILCRNRIAFFEILFACARMRAILVPLNWRSPANEVQGIVDDCQPRLVLYGREDEATAQALDVSCPKIALDGYGPESYDALIKKASTAPLPDGWSNAIPWYLLYTSGTTGKPKAVIQTVQMAVMNMINCGTAVDLVSTDRTLNFLPLFHTAGINLYTLPALFKGAHVTVLDGFDVDVVMQLIADKSIDLFFGVPTCYQAISQHGSFNDIDLTSIKQWGCGGAPLPDVMVETFAEKGALVCSGYGMTETGPTAYLMRPENVRIHIGSVGHIQVMTDIRIVDENNNPVPQSQTGEVHFRGPAITPGYWNRPEATKEAFTEDGWLKSGDLAYEDADGFTYVVGRSKDMYISGGENVYPAEVENVYVRHPAIFDIAIIGVPDEKWGEVGEAHIQLQEGRKLDTDDLIQYGRTHLAPFKVPKSFVFRQDFPRTAAGKIQKHLLRETLTND